MNGLPLKDSALPPFRWLRFLFPTGDDYYDCYPMGYTAFVPDMDEYVSGLYAGNGIQNFISNSTLVRSNVFNQTTLSTWLADPLYRLKIQAQTETYIEVDLGRRRQLTHVGACLDYPQYGMKVLGSNNRKTWQLVLEFPPWAIHRILKWTMTSPKWVIAPIAKGLAEKKPTKARYWGVVFGVTKAWIANDPPTSVIDARHTCWQIEFRDSNSASLHTQGGIYNNTGININQYGAIYSGIIDPYNYDQVRAGDLVAYDFIDPVLPASVAITSGTGSWSSDRGRLSRYFHVAFSENGWEWHVPYEILTPEGTWPDNNDGTYQTVVFNL